MLRSFASDNNAGVHPEIMRALAEANSGAAKAYGADEHTALADEKLREHFGEDIDPYFVFLGTAANVLSIRCLSRSFNAVVCADTAHINRDEGGAPEAVAGVKLLQVEGENGKLHPRQLERFLHSLGNEHHSQPKIVSITQATELGTCYTPEDIRALAEFAHDNGLYLHMDGARLCNAAAFLGTSLGELTAECGVDALSFGGTKNGLMYGEAVIFFNDRLSRDFKYLRKQAMQLASKTRFIAAQFTALLTDDLWLQNAAHANEMARLLADKVQDVPGVRISRPVESNHVFARVEPRMCRRLMEDFYFYLWNKDLGEVRWMTSFDTTAEEVEAFAAAIEQAAP